MNKELNASFKQICNTAVLRSGALRSQKPIDIIVNLALVLIEKKKYEKTNKKSFIEDFNDFFHLHINGIVIDEVIKVLISRKIIFKNGIDGLKVNCEAVSSLNNLEAYNSFIGEADIFIDYLYEYLRKKGKELRKDEVEMLLSKQIEQSVSILGNDLSKNDCLSNDEEYLFDDFIKLIKNENSAFYEIYKRLVIGRLFASFLCSNTEILKNKDPLLNNLSLIFDTGFVLRLLGLDIYSSKEEYLDLIHVLKSLGAKIYIFDHTLQEIYSILDSSKIQCSSISNQNVFVSRVAQYFMREKYSDEDIEEYIVKLPSVLKNIGIDTFECEVDYNSPFALDFNETTILSILRNHYKSTGFYNSDKEHTYALDAKSIFYIHHLRKGKKYRKFSDSKFVFVTTNKGVAQVAKMCSTQKDNSILFPYAITDAYLSLLIFFAYPNYSEDTNLRLLLPTAYHAFKPNNELLNRMIAVLNDMKKKGAMNDAEVFSWLSDTVLQKEIVEVTNGSATNFDENTPSKVLEKIQLEANDFVDSMCNEAEKKIKVAQEERDDLFSKVMKIKEEKNELINELNKKDLKEQEILKKKMQMLNQRFMRRTRFYKFIFFSLSIILVLGVFITITLLLNYWIIKKEQQIYSWIITLIIDVLISFLDYKFLLKKFGALSYGVVQKTKISKEITECNNQLRIIGEAIEKRKNQ